MKPTKRTNYKGFTLTELLIVISILAILATIAFLSFNGYSKSARDSTRITDMKSIQQGLAIQKVKSGTYPQPEGDTLEIIVNSETLIQGYIKDNISNIIRINKTPLDPKDLKNYIYTVDKDRTKAQLMGYLENGETINLSVYNEINKLNLINKINLINELSLLNQTYADTNTGAYQDRSPYTIGDKLGILLDENKLPLQETITNTGIDLSSTDTTGFVAYFGGDTYGEGISTGTGDVLITQIVGAITNTIPCNPTSYSGYTISALSHNQTDTFTKPITIANGTSSGSLTIQCINGTLDTVNAIETTSINCNTNYVLDNQICQQDICTGSAPEFSIANGTQKYNIPWLHSTTPKDCSYICQAGYYYNNSNLCIPASIGNIVPTQGLSTQTPCSDNSTFQDTTGQTSCKTVQSGYYSTPIGTGPKTGETQCEVNNYCVNGVKTSCPVNYSSLAGSTNASACTPNTQVATCGGTIPVNSTASTSATYTQTWNGTIWTPTTSWGENQATCDFGCNTNYSWNGSSCLPSTQTFTCSAKPTTGTLWNSVSSYIQTWNGANWLPANSTTIYNATTSTTSCNYKCDTGYTWNGTICASCPTGYSFISARNRCETAPTCTTGTYNPTTDKCESTSTNTYVATLVGGVTYNLAIYQGISPGVYTDSCDSSKISTSPGALNCPRIGYMSSNSFTNSIAIYQGISPGVYTDSCDSSKISTSPGALNCPRIGYMSSNSFTNSIAIYQGISPGVYTDSCDSSKISTSPGALNCPRIGYMSSLSGTYGGTYTCNSGDTLSGTTCTHSTLTQTTPTCASLGILDGVNNVCYVN